MPADERAGRDPSEATDRRRIAPYDVRSGRLLEAGSPERGRTLLEGAPLALSVRGVVLA